MCLYDVVGGGRGSNGRASDFLTRAEFCLLCPFGFHAKFHLVKNFAMSKRSDTLVLTHCFL